MTRFFNVINQSVTVVARDDAGAPVTGKIHSDFTIAYRKGVAGAMVDVTPATLAAVTTAHADGGVKELNATTAPGAYRIDLPDAAFTSGAGESITVHCVVAGALAMHLEVELVDQITVASGAVVANVTHFGGVAGTFASGRPEVNMTHIAGSAVSASTAQLGVNVVNFGGAAGTFSSGRPETNASHWGGTAVASALVRGNVIQWTGTNVTTPDTAGSPKVTVTGGTGTGQIDLSSGQVRLQAVQTGTTIPTVTTLTNAPSDSAGVTTLLSRIPPGIFTGITSLAQWLGLIAGKQTGNSTARTELRATGAGSGTFDETTDSQEANRDNMQAAAQAAIEANHLDHLLAADYDPASKPGVSTALLNELVESDSGVSRYTANALEQAPSGTGASAAAIRAEIDSNSTQLAKLGTPAGASLAADIATRMAASSYVAPPSAADIWTNGTRTLTDGAGMKKNTAFANFPFKMVDASGDALTGLTVTATRMIDSGSFAACTNSPAEAASGWYRISLAAADLNGDVVTLRFTASGAQTREIVIVTEP